LAVWALLNLEGAYFGDARAYWSFDFDDLYGTGQVGVRSAYLYSPAFAQVMAPFGLLPWPLFAAAWSAVNLGALAWMAGPRIAALLLVIPGSPIADEISTGNLHLLIGAAVVIGFRHPGAWALPLLTKVTPGVGVLWFAGRRAWRPLLVALLTTGAITLVSFALAPDQWSAWFEVLRRSSEVPVSGSIAVIPGPLGLRVAVAAVVALAAGFSGRRWLAPIPLVLALPVPWSSGLAILVAMIPLGRDDAVGLYRRMRDARAEPTESTTGTT
jgi:hypothetical protein